MTCHDAAQICRWVGQPENRGSEGGALNDHLGWPMFRRVACFGSQDPTVPIRAHPKPLLVAASRRRQTARDIAWLRLPSKVREWGEESREAGKGGSARDGIFHIGPRPPKDCGHRTKERE